MGLLSFPTFLSGKPLNRNRNQNRNRNFAQFAKFIGTLPIWFAKKNLDHLARKEVPFIPLDFNSPDHYYPNEGVPISILISISIHVPITHGFALELITFAEELKEI